MARRLAIFLCCGLLLFLESNSPRWKTPQPPAPHDTLIALSQWIDGTPQRAMAFHPQELNDRLRAHHLLAPVLDLFWPLALIEATATTSQIDGLLVAQFNNGGTVLLLAYRQPLDLPAFIVALPPPFHLRVLAPAVIAIADPLGRRRLRFRPIQDVGHRTDVRGPTTQPHGGAEGEAPAALPLEGAVATTESGNPRSGWTRKSPQAEPEGTQAPPIVAPWMAFLSPPHERSRLFGFVVLTPAMRQQLPASLRAIDRVVIEGEIDAISEYHLQLISKTPLLAKTLAPHLRELVTAGDFASRLRPWLTTIWRSITVELNDAIVHVRGYIDSTFIERLMTQKGMP
ncbi:MAG: hypothetical protein HYV02_07680 [Deltaproteobacteria bacterium]|nr:hypothetical protein [Deltaproteobacteria bacterium]